jgi:hypothetical protein
MQLTRIVLILALLASASYGAEPIGAEKVTGNLVPDRLARILQVNQAQIHVDAQRPFTSASVRLEFYRNGKKIDTITAAAASHVNPQTTAIVSLQTADLDFLKLADGKSGNIRFHVELTTSDRNGPSLYTAQSHDVAKTVCSLTELSGASWWPKGTIHDGALPLCWLMHAKGKGVKSGENPSNLVENNPDADIVVVSLVLTDLAHENKVAAPSGSSKPQK